MRDFQGFRFGNVHSEDLNLMVVSSGSRYDKNLLPEPNDYSVDIPGGNGKYYFGQTHQARNFSVSVAFDNVSEENFRKIAQLFANDKLQDLVFDEMPYKTYRAKIKSNPNFSYVCFTDKETEQRVYKGEGTLQFICYFPYAFCFNKYVVRAADFYNCISPQEIIEHNKERKTYWKERLFRIKPQRIKEHYNVNRNMNEPWKGGYPTIEQVQQGELFFKDTYTNTDKRIIDVEGYWDNIPKWEETAKLLTTPTLDYDQELIFLPQYNRFDYINMDIGDGEKQAVIGSRVLIYNPGDVPIDFELKLGNLRKHLRGIPDGMDFRINRYNVQRLSIEQAVDWVNMKTVHKDDEEKYKYANRYFKEIRIDGNENPVVSYSLLKTSHPRHTYIVEPIPREKLGYYIRLFYWQSFQLPDDNNILWSVNQWDYEKACKIADRYEELYNTLSEEEQYALYWQTLKDTIIKEYVKAIGKTENITEDDFIDQWIWNPPEYTKEDKTIQDDYYHKYGEFDFNLSKLPQFITEDYLRLNTDDIPGYDQFSNTPEDITQPLYVDTETRNIYVKKMPEWNQDKTSEKFSNFYNYKSSKESCIDALKQGKWFKLPPGWSLIDISPVIDEDVWGGKRWIDAREFKWSAQLEEIKKAFDIVYKLALIEFLPEYYPNFSDTYEKKNGKIYKDNEELSIEELEELLQFKKWYEGNYDSSHPIDSKGMKKLYLDREFDRKKNESAEYKFLKTLVYFWKKLHLESVGTWWWSAENYMWINFPPLYWGYMDVLNNLSIDYTPLFY